MFSPAAADGGPATATRSRRRQRPKSSESLVQPPKAKRQRLPLTEQTFANPEPAADNTKLKPEKPASLDAKHRDHGHNTPRKELSVRTKKPKHADRAANKGDGSLVLVRHPPRSKSDFLPLISSSRQAQMLSLSPGCRACQTESGPTGQVGSLLKSCPTAGADSKLQQEINTLKSSRRPATL